MENNKQLTKKERRALRKLEKKKEKEQRERRKFIKKILTWTILIVISIGGLFGLTRLVSEESSQISSSVVLINENDQLKGNRRSEIVLIEYSDFQCPACASYLPIVKKLAEEFSDRVAFVYRHFPLDQHQHAQIAAQATEAAGKQGKFWQMHDKLFENQDTWSDQKNAQELFIQYAQELELDLEQFKDDLDSKEVKDKVNYDYQSGVSGGVNATPTFFLDGKKLTNPRGYQEFKDTLEKAISSQQS